MTTANYKAMVSTPLLSGSSYQIVALPAGIANGDTLVACLYTDDDSAADIAGWTKISDELVLSSDASLGRLTVWTKVRAGSETTCHVNIADAQTLYGAVQIVAIDDSVLPTSAHIQQQSAGTAAYSVTGGLSGDVLLAFCFEDYPDSGSLVAVPSGFTAPGYGSTGECFTSSYAATAGRIRYLVSQYKELGSSGTVSVSSVGFATGWYGRLITLRIVASAVPVVSNTVATIVADDGGTVQVVGTRTPTSYAAVSGLVTGITLNTSTGVITVADTVEAGTYSIVVTATNGSGTSAQATITIHVVGLTLATEEGTVRVWRGDSSTGAVAAEKLLYTSTGSASVETSVTATINGHSFSIDSWTPTKFADAWNASDLQEFSEITATAGSHAVTLTADDDGRDFTVDVTFGDGTSETFVIDDIARPLGPAVWNDPRNWRDENDEIGVPGSGDKIIINRKCTISECLIQWCSCTLSEDEEWLVLDTAFPSFVLNQRVTLHANGADHATAYFIRAVKNNLVQIGVAPDSPAEMPTWIGAGSYDAGELVISARPAELDCRAEVGTSVIGLPRHQRGGALEYRPRHLRLECPQVYVGNGDGQGPGQLFLDLGAYKSNVIVFGSGTQSGWLASVDLLAASNETNITVAAGQVGLAVDPTTTATVRRITAYGGQVLLGKQAVWTYITEAFKSAFKRWV